VKVFGIGAANPVGHERHFAVGDDPFDRFLQADGAQVARLAAKVVFDFSPPWQNGNPPGRAICPP
jgi:hypothetical protein